MHEFEAVTSSKDRSNFTYAVFLSPPSFPLTCSGIEQSNKRSLPTGNMPVLNHGPELKPQSALLPIMVFSPFFS